MATKFLDDMTPEKSVLWRYSYAHTRLDMLTQTQQLTRHRVST